MKKSQAHNNLELSESIFISATDTGVGKTFFSAKILRHLLDLQKIPAEKIAYYKPIQCGREVVIVDGKERQQSDCDYIKARCPEIACYNTYNFEHPCSPHLAAKLADEKIDLKFIAQDFEQIQEQHEIVLVEGAGGLAVPLGGKYLVSDIAAKLKLAVILVTRPDLGTLNHTNLSKEHLRSKKLKLDRLLFSAPQDRKEKYSIEDEQFLQLQYIDTWDYLSK